MEHTNGADRAEVASEIQAWAVSTGGGTLQGQFAPGQPWELLDRSGTLNWTVNVHVPFETIDPPGYFVQGIDPDYSYASPQRRSPTQYPQVPVVGG
jgi:hypothetical protein